MNKKSSVSLISVNDIGGVRIWVNPANQSPLPSLAFSSEEVISSRYVIVNTLTLVEYIKNINIITTPLVVRLLLDGITVEHTLYFSDGILFDTGLDDEECEWTLESFSEHYTNNRWAVWPLHIFRNLDGTPIALDRDAIKNYYHQYLLFTGTKAEDFIIEAGGACVMYGIREFTGDLDMTILDDAYLGYLTSPIRLPLEIFNGTVVISWDNYIDLHPMVTPKDTVMIDGICVLSAKSLLDQKLRMNRPKDQDDISVLQEMLSLKSENMESITDIPKTSNVVSFSDKITQSSTDKPINYVRDTLHANIKEVNKVESEICGFTMTTIYEDSSVLHFVGHTGVRSVVSRLIGEESILNAQLIDSVRQ